MDYYARPHPFPIQESYALIRKLQPGFLIGFKQGANGGKFGIRARASRPESVTRCARAFDPARSGTPAEGIKVAQPSA
jgi:hypothetical protein